jgi:hypothetical protein
VAYNFQTRCNKTQLSTEYENVIQKVLFGKAVFTELMSGGKCDVIIQNVDSSREANMEIYRTQK